MKNTENLITRYTAGDQFDLNKVCRVQVDITNEASGEMDELSKVLDKAPKYTGRQRYRAVNVYSKETMKSLKVKMEPSSGIIRR